MREPAPLTPSFMEEKLSCPSNSVLQGGETKLPPNSVLQGGETKLPL